MGKLRFIFLLFAVCLIIAHSVFPHRHLESDVEVQQHKHHHHHSQSGTHHHDESDDQSQGVFAFGKLDHTFLAGKQLIVPVTIATVIEVYNWSVVKTDGELETDDFYIKDIELPPWIRCREISFRGPPTI